MTLLSCGGPHADKVAGDTRLKVLAYKPMRDSMTALLKGPVDTTGGCLRVDEYALVLPDSARITLDGSVPIFHTRSGELRADRRLGFGGGELSAELDLEIDGDLQAACNRRPRWLVSEILPDT
ncbi:MAG: hypothetical protein ABIM89_12985 [Mycobacteriales bacterium]